MFALNTELNAEVKTLSEKLSLLRNLSSQGAAMQNSELDCNEEKRLKSNCRGKTSGFQTEMSSLNVITQYVLCVKLKRLICSTHINYMLYKTNTYNQPMK